MRCFLNSLRVFCAQPISMPPQDTAKRERKRIAKLRKRQCDKQQQRSKDLAKQERTHALTATSGPPTISAPGTFIHTESGFKSHLERSLHFIIFLGCGHNGFYTTGTPSLGVAFVSTLRLVDSSSSTPVAIEQIFIFDKACPGCDARGRILDEPQESSFVRALDRHQRWDVSFPEVQNTVPDAVRRFGRFSFEEERAHGGRCPTKYVVTDRRPVYVEEVLPPLRTRVK